MVSGVVRIGTSLEFPFFTFLIRIYDLRLDAFRL